MILRRFSIALALILFSTSSVASTIPRLYHVYATKHSVPVEVFFSVIKQESGRTVRGKYLPWPWTLNVNHKAYYYSTKEQAKIALYNFLKNSKNTIAVGLGQIYLPAHGKRFKNPLTLLDPHTNLNFAAKLLRYEFNQAKKKDAKSNWWTAAGRYHHPTKLKFSIPYRKSVFNKCLRISNQFHTFGVI